MSATEYHRDCLCSDAADLDCPLLGDTSRALLLPVFEDAGVDITAEADGWMVDAICEQILNACSAQVAEYAVWRDARLGE